MVREAREHEYDEVGSVTFLGFGHGEPGAAQPDEARERLLRDARTRAEQGAVLVAVDESQGRIVGTASLLRPGVPLTRQSRDGEAEVRLLAVLREARGAGAGWSLMTAALETARRWASVDGAVDSVVLDTGPNNIRSQRLYARLGFDRVPERETQPASQGGFLVVFRYDLAAQ